MGRHPQQKGLLILFDGVDGTGKSTIAKEVAAQLDAYYYKSPPEPYASRRDLVPLQEDPAGRLQFFMAANQQTSEEIKDLVKMGVPVVMDRYWPTTYAHHVAMQPELAMNFDPSGFIQPDISFFLFASERLRANRIARRDQAPHGPDKPLERDQVYQSRVQHIFRTDPIFKPLRPIALNTGRRLLETTVQIALEQVMGRARKLGLMGGRANPGSKPPQPA